MPARRRVQLALLVAFACLGQPGTAAAAPPPNDSPSAPATFQPYTAENGTPTMLQGTAELAEATPDPGVPRCLGAKSFARTVWFVVPAGSAPHELSIEASGETLATVDLAAFVQPAGATAPVVNQPNACSGDGAGGANAAEEPTSGISLRVPAGRAVLIQVGRRGRPGSVNDERAVVTLDDQSYQAPAAPPAGDSADPGTPKASADAFLPLFGATITEEDPAEPPCPALGTVWRRFVPTNSGPRLVTVSGNDAETLTVFAGPAPSGGNALDCVDRSGRGEMQMLVQAKARRPLWIRIGTDAPAANSSAHLRIQRKTAFVVDGGPGGFDPTPFGPAGGLPIDCDRADASKASISGSRFGGKAKKLNARATLTLRTRIKKGPLCDVDAHVVGPGGHVYASLRAIRVKSGRRTLSLTRERKFRRGTYSLQVTALSALGEAVRVRSTVTGKAT